MSYRPAQHPPSGKWGRFLDHMRRENDWSAVRAWEELHAVLGLSPKSVAVYKAMERGTRLIRPAEADALIRFFGRGPEDEPEAESNPAPDLASVLNGLTKELEEMRRERETWTRGLIQILRLSATGQVPIALLDALAPLLPEGVQR